MQPHLSASNRDVPEMAIYAVKKKLRQANIKLPYSCVQMRAMTGTRKKRIGLFGRLMQLAYLNGIATKTANGVEFHKRKTKDKGNFMVR